MIAGLTTGVLAVLYLIGMALQILRLRAQQKLSPAPARASS